MRIGYFTEIWREGTASVSGGRNGGGSGGRKGFETKFGAVEKFGKRGEALAKGVEISGANGEVAEFAAGARFFAVEMEVGVGQGEGFARIGNIADEIEHGARGGSGG